MPEVVPQPPLPQASTQWASAFKPWYWSLVSVPTVHALTVPPPAPVLRWSLLASRSADPRLPGHRAAVPSWFRDLHRPSSHSPDAQQTPLPAVPMPLCTTSPPGTLSLAQCQVPRTDGRGLSLTVPCSVLGPAEAHGDEVAILAAVTVALARVSVVWHRGRGTLTSVHVSCLQKVNVLKAKKTKERLWGKWRTSTMRW